MFARDSDWERKFDLRAVEDPNVGDWGYGPAPWPTTDVPHPWILTQRSDELALIADGTTVPGCADHGPGSITVKLHRKTYINTASSVMYDERGTRYPGFRVVSLKDLKHFVPKDTLTTPPRSGILSSSDLKRVRKAMRYHDLCQRYFGHGLRKLPERFDTIYLRDEGGQLQAAVVDDCHPDGTYDVSIAVRGKLILPYDISYDVANLDTGRSFDPFIHRRVVRLDDVVQVMGHLAKGHCQKLEERIDLALDSRWRSR